MKKTTGRKSIEEIVHKRTVRELKEKIHAANACSGKKL